MKSPIQAIKGKIIEEKNGAVIISAPVSDWRLLVDREVKEVEIRLLDSRPISTQQRKAIYSLLNAIADWSGDTLESTKTHMKLKYLIEVLHETADAFFSLADASMSMASAFQSFLIDFCLSWDVPTKEPLYQYSNDIETYVYACAVNRKCAVCGLKAELHHVDRVGIGRDRHDIVHEGMEAISLCRRHHNEIHQIGDSAFFDRYHFDGGIILDKTLCKVYKLKGGR